MFRRRRKRKFPQPAEGVTQRKVNDETYVESITETEEGSEGAYSAIPLWIEGNPNECSEKLQSVLEDVIAHLEQNGITVPTGTEALKALYSTLQTSVQIEEMKTAERASRQ